VLTGTGKKKKKEREGGKLYLKETPENQKKRGKKGRSRGVGGLTEGVGKRERGEWKCTVFIHQPFRKRRKKGGGKGDERNHWKTWKKGGGQKGREHEHYLHQPKLKNLELKGGGEGKYTGHGGEKEGETAFLVKHRMPLRGKKGGQNPAAVVGKKGKKERGGKRKRGGRKKTKERKKMCKRCYKIIGF